MSNSLTDGQKAVLKAFADFGQPMDDQALTVFVHHVADESMSSSGIRSRRAELARWTPRPLLKVVGTKTLSSGRKAAIHDLTAAGKSRVRALNNRKKKETASAA